MNVFVNLLFLLFFYSCQPMNASLSTSNESQSNVTPIGGDRTVVCSDLTKVDMLCLAELDTDGIEGCSYRELDPFSYCEKNGGVLDLNNGEY